MKKIFAASALFCAVTAFGSGFQVLEQGASNIGTALAGSTANANNDASAAFWNPSAAIFSGLAVGETQMDSSFTFMIPSIVRASPQILALDSMCLMLETAPAPAFWLSGKTPIMLARLSTAKFSVPHTTGSPS